MELSKEEKKSALDGHLRNLAYNAYNAELSIIQENAKNEPSAETLKTLTDRVNETKAQIAALEKELAKLGF